MGLQDKVFDVRADLEDAVAAKAMGQGTLDTFDEIVTALWSYEDRCDKAQTRLAQIRTGAHAFLDAIGSTTGRATTEVFEHYGNAPPPGERIDPTEGMD